MAKPSHRIASALKPLLFLLQMLGLLPLKLDSDYTVIEITRNMRTFFTIYDAFILLIIARYGVINLSESLDSTWITIIHIGLLSFRIVKIIAWNIRRWKYKSLLLNIWRGLIINEKPYFKYGVPFNVGYITFWSLASIVANSLLKVGYIMMLFCDGKGALEGTLKGALVSVAAITDFAAVVICAEYLSYCFVLREYFLKIEAALTRMITKTFIVRGKNDTEYIRMVNLGYFSICDVCNNVTRVLRFPIVIAVIESITFITVHGHNLISKVYAGKITEFWFFDYRYSIMLITQHTISLFVVIMPAHLLLASANKIKDTLRNLDTTSKSREVLQSIKLFSLQVIHEDFKITPAGLFTIDLNLAYIVFGTLASYIVIIIQFDVMYVE